MKNIYKRKMSVFNCILFCILILYCLLFITLALWGLTTSLKTRNDFYSNKLWLPKELAFSNYSYVWQNFAVTTIDGLGRKVSIDIYAQTFNTLLYAVGGGFVTTVCCCIVAYLSAKFKYMFSEIVYVIVVVTMVVPIVGSTPAMLKFLKWSGLYDTWFGAYVMKFNFLGLYFLIFHGVFRGISPEYSEAATLDGANEYQIFFKIMFPLVATMFNTVFLIQFIAYWNDYTMALLYMPTHPTLAYGVYYMSTSNINGLSSVPMRMVSCVILALPLTIFFVAFRDKLVGNVTLGGVKE